MAATNEPVIYALDDSLDNDSVMMLDEFTVEGRRNTQVIPVQTLKGEELKRLNSNSVADALRYFAGVQVKDYGGVGGIKTVNIRSMGTNHTGVVYDGVALGNAQNGQIDLGQFSLDNVEAISLYNGQKSEILQPAKDFGSAGTIYMRTRTPKFHGNERYHARVTLRGGSFDMFNISALGEFKISSRVNAQLNAEWLTSSGKYKFRYRRVTPAGEVAYDTTAVRQNGDVDALRLEMNVNGTMNNGRWNGKVYHYNSERGIPGAIVNNVWRRGERVWDNNTFAQGSWTAWWGDFTTMANAKYAYYATRYVNNDESQLKVDNRFRQLEAYFSTANEYMVTNWLRFALSYDLTYNIMDADMYDFAVPTRWTNMIAGAASLSLQRLKIQASALGTFISDDVEGKDTGGNRRAFSPAVYLSYSFPHGFGARAFYKRSFRMPTFNDLYYTDMGNSKLSPERVTQYNLGGEYNYVRHGFLKAARVSVDAYYNRVHDKIVAYPKGQQFRWTMLNLGLVDIRGIDFSGLVTINPVSDLDITFRAQYTWQRAIDVTSPTDNYYRHQIPYIPWHSGSAVVNASWRGWSLNYSFIYVGERYNQQENIKYNYTQPWYTSDVSASRDFRIWRLDMRALIEVNNLLNQDYDVIANYPMPKRNYRLTLTIGI